MDSLISIVRQHAHTTRLFGVDFMPCSGSASLPGEVRVTARAHESASATRTAAPGSADTQALREVKPLLRAASTNTDLNRHALFPRPPREDKESEAEYAQRLLELLRARYESDAPHKHFITAHTRIVFGEGCARARLCFVGEAPGEEEDRTGRPFVGRAGQLLNKMIAAMGMTREDVYICNVLKTRPPNNATPTEREAALCEPYLLEQLSIVSPEVIVALGLPASRLLLKTDESMGRMRGTWRQLTLPDGRIVPVMPTYHPAFILRSYTEENRRKVWNDLRLVMSRLGLAAGRSGPTD